jgi:hypothetical protein
VRRRREEEVRGGEWYRYRITIGYMFSTLIHIAKP